MSLSSAEEVLVTVFVAFLPESNRIEGKEVNKMMKMTKIRVVILQDFR